MPPIAFLLVKLYDAAMPRPKIPAPIQDQILSECRRRCALCFALNNDVTAKVHGQLAHIDRNPHNNRADNLAYLCLEHANLYDAVARQSKGFTPGELRRYQADLVLILNELNDPRYVRRIVRQEFRKQAAKLAAEAIAAIEKPPSPQHRGEA